MRTTPTNREAGIAMVHVVMAVVFLLSLGASTTMLCTVGLRASGENNARMRAFYVADSGAQVANAQIRATSGVLTTSATSFSESIGDGVAEVDVVDLGDGIFEVTSAGSVGVETRTVVMHVEFTDVFDMEGALQINFGSGIEVEAATIDLDINASTEISGLDHDPTGVEIGDQTEATYGVAMTPIPGSVDTDIFVDVSNGADLEGSPETTSNEVTGQSEVFDDLITHARDNADVVVNGSTTLRNVDDGDYGTETDPVLVYVSLGDNETFEMRQNIHGWGTLVIDVDTATTDTALYMRDSTEWHGLVVVNFLGEAEINGGTLIELDNHAKIIGGLAVQFSGDNITFEGTGNVVELNTGSASILYSSEMLSSAVGIDQVVDSSARVIAYRID